MEVCIDVIHAKYSNVIHPKPLSSILIYGILYHVSVREGVLLSRC